MTTETRVCQNCAKPFVIEPEDFAFYEKIAVPAPTFCSSCRLQRRMAFLNLIHLYRRSCDLCRKEVVSKYPPDAPLTVYCTPCWYSDRWDPLSFGRDYDFTRPFFLQFRDLLAAVPIPALDIDPVASASSPFTNHAGNLKNCHLVFFAAFGEDCLYGFSSWNGRLLVDFSLAGQSEACYDSDNIFQDNRCIGVENTTASVGGTFLRDCVNCQECFGSANLRNKKYYIFNQPYTKEGYMKERARWDLGSYRTYQELRQRARTHWKNYPPRPTWMDFSTHCTGNYVFESKNCTECYEVSGAENSKYLTMTIRGPVRDCYDITAWGDNLSHSYEAYIGTNISGAKFCMESNVGARGDSEYCFFLSAANLFGCVSTRNNEYCILNRQYTKEEFVSLRARIIEHMNAMPYVDGRGREYRYGEFFPIEMSWSPYNETMAQVFFPLTKEQARAEGYAWRDPQPPTHQMTMRVEDIPDHVKDAPDGIVNEIIACPRCPRGYRILTDELAFLRRMNVPLPRMCPFCRIEARIVRWRGQMNLVERSCTLCGAEFRTPYTTETAPVIWCSRCYQEQTS